MPDNLPERLAHEVQQYTNAPWWNGEAYANFRGYPGQIRRMGKGIGDAVEELARVIDDLRRDGRYEDSDRLRSLAGQLARLQPPYVDDEPMQRIRDIARGWT